MQQNSTAELADRLSGLMLRLHKYCGCTLTYHALPFTDVCVCLSCNLIRTGLAAPPVATPVRAPTALPAPAAPAGHVRQTEHGKCIVVFTS